MYFSAQAGGAISSARGSTEEDDHEEDDDEDDEDEDARNRRIQAIIDGGGVDVFARYVGNFLDDPEDWDNDQALYSIDSLMRNHPPTDDSFWTQAWPVEVYVKHDDSAISFDTLWSGTFPTGRPSDLSDIPAQNRWNWYNALTSFRYAGAGKDDIITFANHYAEAIKLAARGLATNPPRYQAHQTHAEYLVAMDDLVKDGMNHGLWLDAAERLRTLFGDRARDELLDQFNASRDAIRARGIIPDGAERNIYYNALHRKVVLDRGGRANSGWFEALNNYIQRCGNRYDEWRDTARLITTPGYVQGNRDYRPMCEELTDSIDQLRRQCRDASIFRWQVFVQAGADRAARGQRYFMFQQMDRGWWAEGLPYPPPADGRVETDPAALDAYAKAQSMAADIDAQWDIEARKLQDIGDLAGGNALQTLKLEMQNSGSLYGPFYARNFQHWDNFLALVNDHETLPLTSKFRVQDLRDRVLDMYTHFGVLTSCQHYFGDPIDEVSCEGLVGITERSMTDANEEIWRVFFQLTTVEAADHPERVRLETLRKRLQDHGYHWAPHEPEPIFPTAGAQISRLGFGAERSGVQGTWRFRGTLGEGSWGHAGLWERTTDDSSSSSSAGGGVIDRIVVKETYQHRMFNVPGYWQGPLFGRVVKEEAIMRYLSSLSNSQNVVRPLAVALYEGLRMYRIYMEYCPYGDLEGTIERYVASGARIPEGRIWAIFEGLLNVLCLMRDGRLPEDDPSTTASEVSGEHDSIIHRDIKPANIFLGKLGGTEEEWEGYPVVKMGDFGLAARISDANVTRNTGMGTRGYAAPEQQAGATVG
jgi:hypothetical protein